MLEAALTHYDEANDHKSSNQKLENGNDALMKELCLLDDRERQWCQRERMG